MAGRESVSAFAALDFGFESVKVKSRFTHSLKSLLHILRPSRSQFDKNASDTGIVCVASQECDAWLSLHPRVRFRVFIEVSAARFTDFLDVHRHPLQCTQQLCLPSLITTSEEPIHKRELLGHCSALVLIPAKSKCDRHSRCCTVRPRSKLLSTWIITTRCMSCTTKLTQRRSSLGGKYLHFADGVQAHGSVGTLQDRTLIPTLPSYKISTLKRPHRTRPYILPLTPA